MNAGLQRWEKEEVAVLSVHKEVTFLKVRSFIFHFLSII